jgi:hypothetical protein
MAFGKSKLFAGPAFMQNRFIQLTKYKIHLSDPQENRATEALAACLTFSPTLKREFLHFLFPERRSFDAPEGAEYEISTQQPTADGGWVDLLLEKHGAEAIVVEVKVRAGEDEAQIRKYRNWLEQEKKGMDHYVFNLVKYHDPNFHIQKCGGERTCEWKYLYEHFSRVAEREAGTAEASLIRHFCSFLEMEEIVITWNPQEIEFYSRGVAAKHALSNLFEQVANRLSDLRQDYDTRILIPDAEWPRLEVGRTKAWQPIFGGGYLNKVYVLYQTRGIWNSDVDAFSFQIWLWQRGHKCDWPITESKLPQWMKKLCQRGFEQAADLTSRKDLDSDVLNYKFHGPPHRIYSYSSDPSLAQISSAQIAAMTSEALVEEVFNRVLRHCSVVSELK